MNRYSYMGMLRKFAIAFLLVMMMSVSSFADVTVTKDWEDGLIGTAASSREAPTVNLEGSTPYEQLLNIFYPVGSCYMSLDPSFNPNVAWGGTWQKLPAGMNVIQAGGSYAFGSTGGEATHALTVDEMPSHNHEVKINNWAGDLGVGIVPNSTTPGDSNWYGIHDFPENGYHYSSPAGSGSSMYAVARGGSQAHNNMQPYIAGNIWKRTA